MADFLCRASATELAGPPAVRLTSWRLSTASSPATVSPHHAEPLLPTLSYVLTSASSLRHPPLRRLPRRHLQRGHRHRLPRRHPQLRLAHVARRHRPPQRRLPRPVHHLVPRRPAVPPGHRRPHRQRRRLALHRPEPPLLHHQRCCRWLLGTYTRTKIIHDKKKRKREGVN